MSKVLEMASSTLPIEQSDPESTDIMLMTIAIILLLLWVVGLATGSALGGFLPLLLIMAVVMVAFRLIQGSQIR